MKGTVKWFNRNKGFGFIIGDDKQEYFVHWRSIAMEGFKTLVEEERVEFESSEGDKGPQANDVKRVDREKFPF
ncbi:MAG: cold shock domain-containing protein [Candidatus Cloacimonadota bacterium]|nr:cold shock domain-containing protein [Candidatus Cloacimonadota bacterium]